MSHQKTKNSQKKNSKSQKSKNNPDNNKIWIYGKHPVLMAIKNKRRKIFKILISKNNQKDLEDFSHINKSLIQIVDNQFISSFFSQNVLHQGFALQTLTLSLLSEKEFLNQLSKQQKNDLENILILDQLTDPHNIGAIIRSAISFGVKNIILTKHNTAHENAIICKSSAGMIELANLILAGNLNNLLINLKKIGYWNIGLDSHAKENINKITDYPNIALIVGNEGSGIRNLVKKNCDLLAKIPIHKEVESLNASNAATIALYELFKS